MWIPWCFRQQEWRSGCRWHWAGLEAMWTSIRPCVDLTTLWLAQVNQLTIASYAFSAGFLRVLLPWIVSHALPDMWTPAWKSRKAFLVPWQVLLLKTLGLFFGDIRTDVFWEADSEYWYHQSARWTLETEEPSLPWAFAHLRSPRCGRVEATHRLIGSGIFEKTEKTDVSTFDYLGCSTFPQWTDAHGDCEDDVVICCAVRTPLCKAKRGSFKELWCDSSSWLSGFLSGCQLSIHVREFKKGTQVRYDKASKEIYCGSEKRSWNDVRISTRTLLLSCCSLLSSRRFWLCRGRGYQETWGPMGAPCR